MKTTIEWCPYCEQEVEIPAEIPSRCPSCKHVIVPCSTCYNPRDGHKTCDWVEGIGCWRFPFINCLKKPV